MNNGGILFMPMPIMFLIILVLLAVVVARNVVIVPQAADMLSNV